MPEIVRLDGPGLETGPVQIGEDWPGIFIRGDDAGGAASMLRLMMREKPRWSPLLNEWVALLESCHVQTAGRT